MQRNIRVLLADDDEIIRGVIAAICSTISAVQLVGEAQDGEQLLEKFKQTLPDVVLLDIEMPKMTGLVALKRLKEMDPDIAILMLTSQNSPAVVKESLRNGAQGYVLKTNPPDAIRASIRDICFKQLKKILNAASQVKAAPSTSP